jgi:hypothetical protein
VAVIHYKAEVDNPRRELERLREVYPDEYSVIGLTREHEPRTVRFVAPGADAAERERADRENARWVPFKIEQLEREFGGRNQDILVIEFRSEDHWGRGVPLYEIKLLPGSDIVKDGLTFYRENGGIRVQDVVRSVSWPDAPAERLRYGGYDFIEDAEVREDARNTELRLRDRRTRTWRDDGLDLRRIKDKLPHGHWLPWLSAVFDKSTATAERYMAVALLPEPIFVTMRDIGLPALVNLASLEEGTIKRIAEAFELGSVDAAGARKRIIEAKKRAKQFRSRFVAPTRPPTPEEWADRAINCIDPGKLAEFQECYGATNPGKFSEMLTAAIVRWMSPSASSETGPTPDPENPPLPAAAPSPQPGPGAMITSPQPPLAPATAGGGEPVTAPEQQAAD